MDGERYPVVLVHGWMSNPGIWRRFVPQLEAESIPFWNFSYATMNGANLVEIAKSLTGFIKKERENSLYEGPVDLVCHCMGTCIARYMLEVMDTDAIIGDIRQIIGLGPPNNGSSIAELFHDPNHGEAITEKLTGVFLPPGTDPKKDIIVREFRPDSRRMAELREAGIREDITYRCILTANTTADPGFFPLLDGKTWAFSRDTGWETTYLGDGIVPHTDSLLPGAHHDILPVDPVHFGCRPFYYCHVNLPKNTEVLNRVKAYLHEPLQGPILPPKNPYAFTGV